MSFNDGGRLFIDDSLLSKWPFAFEMEAIEKRIHRHVHGQADIQNVIEADAATQATDIEVADKVREREERPVKEIKVWPDIDPKDYMGMGDVENEEAT